MYRCSGRTVVSDQAGEGHRAVPAGRRGGYHRSHFYAQTHGSFRTAVHRRQSGGRSRADRRRDCRTLDRRRLYALIHTGVDRYQPHPVSENHLRHREGLRADRHSCVCAVRSGGASVIACTQREELIALAKAKPGSLFYASTGNGGTPHLATEVFKSQAKINIVHVPYKGTPPAVTDLLGGQVQLMFANTLSVLPHVQGGRLRALAIGSVKRSAAAPQIPTVAESGMPGFEAITWFGMLAPRGTPGEIVTRLSDELRKIGQTPQIRNLLLSQGADPVSNTPAEFRAYLHSELAKWAKVIQDTGVKPE